MVTQSMRRFSPDRSAPKTVRDFFKPQSASKEVEAAAAAPQPAIGTGGGTKRLAPGQAAGGVPKKVAAGQAKSSAATRVLFDKGNTTVVRDGGGQSSSPAAADAVATLCALGFLPSDAEKALNAFKGDVERAANWLLAQ